VTALCSNGELLMSGGIDAKIAHYTRLRGSREELRMAWDDWDDWDGDMLVSGYVKIAIENGHRNSGFSH